MSATRRDMLTGGACVAALGAAEWLRPRRHVELLPENTKLADAVPRAFADWSSKDGGDIVLPRTPGSVSSRIYSDTVSRTYRSPDHDETVMLLIAYGRAQSDMLQLHRPESCYPAVGLSIVGRQPATLDLGRGRMLPALALTARGGDRIEDIVYWARLGEYIPQSASEQRADRLKTAMQGYIADGVLVRASIQRSESDRNGWPVVTGFLTALIHAMRAGQRAVLIGSERANALT